MIYLNAHGALVPVSCGVGFKRGIGEEYRQKYRIIHTKMFFRNGVGDEYMQMYEAIYSKLFEPH